MSLYHAAMYDHRSPAPGCWREMVGGLPENPPALDGDTDCEVAIIGGGFTGLSAALHLARDAGIDSVVLEAGEPGWGASGRNGGFCCLYPSSLSLHALARRYGEAETRAFVDSQREAVDLVDALATGEGFDIQRQGDGTWEVAHNARRGAGLAAEARETTRRFGIPTRVLPKAAFAEQIYDSTEQFGGVHTGVGFGLNPLALVHGLTAAARRRGARVHPFSAVTGWEREGNRHRLLTANGSVRCERVIVAGNGFTPEGMVPALHGRFLPVMSNIIATRPLTDEELAAQRWQTETPCGNTRRMLFYYRLLADRRFLFGARGDTTGSPADAGRMRAWISRRLGEVFPAWRHVPVTHYWRGLICVTLRGTPMIAALDDAGTAWTGMAYHGNGVAASCWTGRLLAQLASGRATEAEVPLVMRGLSPRLPFPALRLWYLRAALASFRLGDLW